jgi:hypothetical protein
MVDGDGSVRRTSEWPCGEELERAARYVRDVRQAPTPAARLLAAASTGGLGSIRALVRGLPALELAFSDSVIGQEMRSWFRPDRRLPFNRVPIASLHLPATTAEYLRGRPRQALRTNLSRAAAEGITCAPITDEGELRLVAEHLAAERGVGVDVMIHTEVVPRPDRLFTAAYDAAGDPVALNQTVVDGPHAGLVLMVHVPEHPAATLMRYALHADVVDRLIGRGASTLTVGGSMLLVSEGTRYFQRRTGFTPVRVEVRAARHEGVAPLRPVVGPITLRRPAVAEHDVPRDVAAVG